MGLIDPLNFAPFPKNPTIARFFKEIGRVDELGSGVRNVFKYSPEYTPGGIPELIEGDVFKTIVPLRARPVIVVEPHLSWEEVRNKVRNKFGTKFVISSEKTLEQVFGNNQISAVGIAEVLGVSPRAIQKKLAYLKVMGIIDRVGSKKTGSWRIILE